MMKACFFHLLKKIVWIGVCLLMLGSGLEAAEVRKAVVAGQFYPSDRAQLKKMIRHFTDQAQETQIKPTHAGALKALIMPHAGYIYSGLTAAHVSHVLSANQFDKVVVLAPDHRVGFKNGAITDARAYETPLGKIPLHEDAAKLLQGDLFQTVPASDRTEHSLEVVLPFLQYYLKTFELVPIVLGRGDIPALTDAVDPLLDDQTLLVVSSDLSHFLPYDQAVAHDKVTLQMINHLTPEPLLRRENAACGAVPLAVLLRLAKRRGWRPQLLHYSNSGDAVGDRQRVVGYAAVAFYGGSSMNSSDHKSPSANQALSEAYGQALVQLARQTIADELGPKITLSEKTEALLDDECLQAQRGTFVTLTIKDQLRGCIGSLNAVESLVESVKRNARNAAFGDPRFGRLKPTELGKIDIEVSILTEPQPLEYKDDEDLIAKLRPHVDGLIIRKGMHSATFLPQVWEQLPGPREFLTHLCHKAGLPPDAWVKENLDVQTYQVQFFHEKK